MEYPKAIMRKSEVVKLGIPESVILRAYRSPKVTCVYKMSPKRNSPILIETAPFERWRVNQNGQWN